MLHTREGSRVAMMCLWYGTAKVKVNIVLPWDFKVLNFFWVFLISIIQCVHLVNVQVLNVYIRMF